MNLRQTYYLLKPFLPRRLTVAARRLLAAQTLHTCRDRWPISESAGTPPPSWPGWPEGKQFAVVLTHDVEGAKGFSRCSEVMRLETSLGFRSSFNLIPMGSYLVTTQFIRESRAKGFEIGVHDLYHNGTLYSSRQSFVRQAARINYFLRKWNALGFRSGFMYHNLEWLKDLEVLYDLSTFDVDPFEPQPDGVDTIFPFWVPRDHHSGYVELPYTLQQDFSLFILLQTRHIDVWKTKLDWIAEHGGMALLNVHPDYLCLDKRNSCFTEYPADYYSELLEYLRRKYTGAYWNALPSEVASYYRNSVVSSDLNPAVPASSRHPTTTRRKIWIDLDNTPHVPFFKPIIETLTARDYPTLVTARDAYQVCELADKLGVAHLRVGRHYGKHRIAKLVGLFLRSLQLLPLVLKEKPLLAISHCSRSQILLCNLLRIPSIMLADYEFSTPLVHPTWVIVPELIPEDAISHAQHRLLRYPGLKENVYVSGFQPDPDLPRTLGLNDTSIIVTVRPPATEAHYHNALGDVLFVELMNMLTRAQRVQIVLLPRNRKQQEYFASSYPEWFRTRKTIVPPTAVSGLDLVWHSDLVVSGGGTMNREAGALGVPVYSIFAGTIGAIDRELSRSGRLTIVRTVEDLHEKIVIQARAKKTDSEVRGADNTITTILNHIDDLYDFYAERRIG
jgi:uncharacterized protein